MDIERLNKDCELFNIVIENNIKIIIEQTHRKLDNLAKKLEPVISIYDVSDTKFQIASMYDNQDTINILTECSRFLIRKKYK